MRGRSRLRCVGVVGLLAVLATACSGTSAPDGTTSGDSSRSPTHEGGSTSGSASDAHTSTTTSTVAGEGGTSSASPTPDAAGSALGAPSAAELQAAAAEVAQLSDEQLVGQVVVAAYGGTDPEAAAAVVRQEHLAGVIVLGANVPEQPEERVPQLSAMAQAVQQAVQDDGRDWPAFIAVDQEGGPITRIGAPLDRWPAPMALGAAGDPELAREVSRASGEQLRALGFTVVFAPDADVTGPGDPTIGARSPGSDPDAVASIATAEATGFADAGLVPVVKHFPGHGTVSADTHLGSAVQEADLATLERRDLVPFAALADAGVPAVMAAHIEVSAVDPGVPATLSEPVLTGLLRDDLGFEGLVITDAMNMAAVTEVASPGEAAVRSVEAGADIVLMPTDPTVATDALLAAMQDGRLSRDDVEESAARVVATLRHTEGVPVPGADVIGSQPDLARQAALAGITQVSGPCGEPLVGDAIQVRGGTETSRGYLEEAAREAGLRTGSGDVVMLTGGAEYQAGGGAGGPGTGSGDVVVSTDVPYALAESRANTALLAAYGQDRATMQALVEVLVGSAPAQGSLPVPVGDWPVGSGCG